MENVKNWLDKKGYYNSGLRTDRNHRIDLYLSDVLEEYKTELWDLFSRMPRSYGIVRWYNNAQEDVVCVDRATAEEYVKKYNKLSGGERCYVDKDIWLPLNEP